MSKMMKVVFCLLISMFVVTQVHADKSFFLILDRTGVRIFDIPKDWSKLGEPVNVLPFEFSRGNRFSELGYNLNRTILWVASSSNIHGDVLFYKIPKNGDLSKIDKIPFFHMDVKQVTAAGFFPSDGTFYIIKKIDRWNGFDSSVHGAHVITFYRIDPDARSEQDRCKKITEFGGSSRYGWDTLIFKPDDPSFITNGYSCAQVKNRDELEGYFNYTSNSKHFCSEPDMDKEFGENPRVIGFSPLGDILIFQANRCIYFLKIPSGNSWQNSFLTSADRFDVEYKNQFDRLWAEYGLGSFDIPRHIAVKVGFLDKDHFYCVQSNSYVVIYRVPPYDKWTKGSISSKSSHSVEAYDGDACMVYIHQDPTSDETYFRNSLTKGKPSESYHDATIFTEGAMPVVPRKINPIVFHPFYSVKFDYISKALKFSQTEKGGLLVKGRSSQGHLICRLAKTKFKKGERFAVRGTLVKGGLGFGLLRQGEMGAGIQETIVSEGSFDVSVTAPETGEYIPVICAFLPEGNLPIACTINECSLPLAQ